MPLSDSGMAAGNGAWCALTGTAASAISSAMDAGSPNRFVGHGSCSRRCSSIARCRNFGAETGSRAGIPCGECGSRDGVDGLVSTPNSVNAINALCDSCQRIPGE